MKLFLIKLGKISSAIKRDGIIIGGRRIWSYLILFIKTLFKFKKGDVLILTGGVGDSAHYRAFSQAEEFNLHGIKTSVTLQDAPFLSNYADKFKVFIFHRTVQTPAVSRLVSNVKKLNKEIIFETDDLVFDAKYIQETDLYKNKMSFLEKKQYEKGVGEEILRDPYVKVCSTTTTYLAKILKSYDKKIFISKNKIINHELEIANKILKKIPKEKDGFIKLGYYSGTFSHNKDFETIADALLEIFKKFSKVKLIIAGPLDFDERLNAYKERIINLPLVPRDRYYKNLYKADINLAPLVLGDPFCESKSEIKFSGAGILEIPTVAVRNLTFSEVISDGVDGFLADNTEEWVEKISKLIENEKLRKEMGEKAREKVLLDYTNKNSHNEEYYEYLRSCITKHET